MDGNLKVFEQLYKLRGSRTIIVGIGNTLKGDDGAGPLVCKKLLQTGVCAEVIDAGTVPENYIQRIIKIAPQNLLIIDAIDFKAAPGTVEIFKPPQLNSTIISTHTLSPRLFADIVAQNIKVDVYFVGIQPAQIQLGQGVSDEVMGAVEQISAVLIEIFSSKE